MTSKANIDSQVRGFYFSQSGNSDFDGSSFEKPKATAQQAIDAATALSPPPSGTGIAVVSSAQGGSFTDGFVLSDFVQFNGQNVSITTSDSIGIELASFLNCTLTTFVSTANNAISYNIDGQQSIGIDADFLGVFGANSIGLKVTGLVDDLFLEISLITITGVGGIGVDVTAEMTTPIDMNFNSISLDADDTIFCQCNSVTTDDTCVLEVSSIKKTAAATNTTAFNMKNGVMIIESGNIQADVALKLETGATINIVCERMIGDIIIDSGGTLHCVIVEHIGTITNNGTINGLIDGVPFGTYQQKPFQERMLLAESFNTQSPVGKDSPLQLEFGSAQFGPSDPVQLDALGNIRINQSDQYNVFITLQYGRIGAGSFSLLFFRILVDGVQTGSSHSAKLDNTEANFPIEFSAPFNFISGQTVTVEIWRDSTGFDAGSLFPETPTLVGANATPSAVILMTRSRLVSVPEVLIFDYTVLLNETGVQTNAAGFVDAWNNSGESQFDLTTVIGSTTSLVPHPSQTALFYGAINDYISTPNSVANRIIGDIDIRVLGVTPINWTPVVNETLVSKYEISGDFAYLFRIGDSGGNLELLLSSNGTDSLLGSSTVPTGFVNGTKHGLRVTWRRFANTTEFFTSEDGVVWNKLGADVFQPRTSIFDSDSSVEIGSREGGTQERFRGTIEDVEIYRGIDGVLEVNFDARFGGYSTGKTTDTFMSSTTGETYTMHGNTFIQNSGVSIINSIGGAALTPSVGVTIAVPMTIFFVAKTHQLTGLPQFFTAGLSNASENPTTSITIGNTFVFNGGVTTLNPGAADTNLRLHIIRYNGDDTTSYEVDGVGINTGDTGTENWDYATILAELGGIATLGGSIGELVVYSRALTNLEVAIVKSALRSKWDGLF